MRNNTPKTEKSGGKTASCLTLAVKWTARHSAVQYEILFVRTLFCQQGKPGDATETITLRRGPSMGGSRHSGLGRRLPLGGPDQGRPHPGVRVRSDASRHTGRYRDGLGPGTRCGAENRQLPAGQVCLQPPHAGPLRAAFRGRGLSPLRSRELRGAGGRDGGLFAGADLGHGHPEHRGFSRGRAPGHRHPSDGPGRPYRLRPHRESPHQPAGLPGPGAADAGSRQHQRHGG